MALFTGKAKSYQHENIVGTMHACKAFFIRLQKIGHCKDLFHFQRCKAFSPISPILQCHWSLKYDPKHYFSKKRCPTTSNLTAWWLENISNRVFYCLHGNGTIKETASKRRKTNLTRLLQIHTSWKPCACATSWHPPRQRHWAQLNRGKPR